MDNELHAVESDHPGRQVRPHRSGGGIDIGTIGHVDHGKMPLAAAVAIAMVGSLGWDSVIDMNARRYPQSPDSRISVPATKSEHDHARIAKAEERRQRRNIKRLRNKGGA